MQRLAPDFTLADQSGKQRSLQDYRGRWVVLYFYSQDESLGCTKQACSFRDEYRAIQQFGDAEVIGINLASVQQHHTFSQKYDLQFPILSDPGHAISDLYGSWSKTRAKLLGLKYATARNTFLIAPDGTIAKKYTNVSRANHHTEQIIADLQKLQKKS